MIEGCDAKFCIGWARRRRRRPTARRTSSACCGSTAARTAPIRTRPRTRRRRRRRRRAFFVVRSRRRAAREGVVQVPELRLLRGRLGTAAARRATTARAPSSARAAACGALTEMDSDQALSIEVNDELPRQIRCAAPSLARRVPPRASAARALRRTALRRRPPAPSSLARCPSSSRTCPSPSTGRAPSVCSASATLASSRVGEPTGATTEVIRRGTRASARCTRAASEDGGRTLPTRAPCSTSRGTLPTLTCRTSLPEGARDPDPQEISAAICPRVHRRRRPGSDPDRGANRPRRRRRRRRRVEALRLRPAGSGGACTSVRLVLMLPGGCSLDLDRLGEAGGGGGAAGGGAAGASAALRAAVPTFQLHSKRAPAGGTNGRETRRSRASAT